MLPHNALARRDGKTFVPVFEGEGRVKRFRAFWHATPALRAKGYDSVWLEANEALLGRMTVSVSATRTDRSLVEREATLAAGDAGLFRAFVDQRGLRRLSGYQNMRSHNSGESMRLAVDFEDGGRLRAEARGPGSLPDKRYFDEAWLEELLAQACAKAGIKLP